MEGNAKSPASVVVCRWTTPVDSLVSATAALGTDAPVASLTVPEICVVDVWAPAPNEISNRTPVTASRLLNFMGPPYAN